jgi:hypothetical protein
VLVTKEGDTTMEEILCEPVELTESELDDVAGGWGLNIDSFNFVKVVSKPKTEINNLVDNSVNISF